MPDNTATDDSSFWIFLMVISLVVAGVVIRRVRKNRLLEQAYRLAQSHASQYHEWLMSYNAYYVSLPANMRQRFIDRVTWFISVKNFECVDIQPDEKMSLLISAAAIQITFGLDKFLLDFFDTIYIMRQQYIYATSQVPFQGHVSSNGIYLSWDNFLRGYEDYTDADNVGIHEMAHALAYVNFMAEANDGQDENFIKRFYNFSTVARPIFNDMQNGTSNLLNPYAATNYNEFWAVSVETFFEKPLQMKMEMPDLYNSLCSLLNQDPLLPEKVVSLS
ncbi:MAG: zinc-dependent peptidase [Chitinophagaceae bacterium]